MQGVARRTKAPPGGHSSFSLGWNEDRPLNTARSIARKSSNAPTPRTPSNARGSFKKSVAAISSPSGGCESTADISSPSHAYRHSPGQAGPMIEKPTSTMRSLKKSSSAAISSPSSPTGKIGARPRVDLKRVSAPPSAFTWSSTRQSESILDRTVTPCKSRREVSMPPNSSEASYDVVPPRSGAMTTPMPPRGSTPRLPKTRALNEDSDESCNDARLFNSVPSRAHPGEALMGLPASMSKRRLKAEVDSPSEISPGESRWAFNGGNLTSRSQRDQESAVGLQSHMSSKTRTKRVNAPLGDDAYSSPDFDGEITTRSQGKKSIVNTSSVAGFNRDAQVEALRYFQDETPRRQRPDKRDTDTNRRHLDVADRTTQISSRKSLSAKSRKEDHVSGSTPRRSRASESTRANSSEASYITYARTVCDEVSHEGTFTSIYDDLPLGAEWCNH